VDIDWMWGILNANRILDRKSERGFEHRERERERERERKLTGQF
jgi:hypothetical protein